MKNNWFQFLRQHPDLLPPEQRARTGGNRLLPLLAEYAGAERLSAAELASRQRMRLRALVRHCNEHSPHFAQRLRTAGLVPQDLLEPAGFRALPPLTRRQLMEAGESLFCRSVPTDHGRAAATSTSGSTGEPVTARRTQLCQLHWLAAGIREHLWHHRRFDGGLAVLRANVTAASDPPNWGAPVNLLFRTGPASLQPPTRPIGEVVDWLIEFAPRHLLVLPSCLAAIVAALEPTGRRLPGLQSIRTLSETVTARLRDDVRRTFGLELHDSYSSQEGGVMAFQCPEANTYHTAEHILLEVVDGADRPCAPGEVGRILMTDLINFATPLIRYEIGDYAEAGEPCPCGRNLAPIRRFLGRERNLVLLPDGTRHWPVVGFHRWAEVFPVRQFRFIQESRDLITAQMSADSRPSPEQEARLAAIIRESLGHPFVIQFLWQPEPLPRGPGGKFEEFHCRAT